MSELPRLHEASFLRDEGRRPGPPLNVWTPIVEPSIVAEQSEPETVDDEDGVG
jgi:hypothetical protein